MKSVIFAVLAGGSGERLWPLSKRGHPKQLISFLGDSCLLEQTIDRVVPIMNDSDELWVITTQEQEEQVQARVGNRVHAVVAEPAARNTGPAILRACMQAQRSQNQDSVFVVLPSDHFIPDKHAFSQALSQAIDYAREHEKITLFGLVPAYPATGYGYIQAVMNKGRAACYPVACFHEKPDRLRAEQYITQSDMFWNIGIFVGKISVFISEFEQLVPLVYKSVQLSFEDLGMYEKTESISIDYAVLEKSVRTVVFPVQFEWYDVGNLYTFLSLKTRYSSTTPVISLDGQDNMASSHKKLVACIGVSDLCIIETDDVLLVAKKESVEDVKKLLSRLKTSHEHML